MRACPPARSTRKEPARRPVLRPYASAECARGARMRCSGARAWMAQSPFLASVVVSSPRDLRRCSHNCRTQLTPDPVRLARRTPRADLARSTARAQEPRQRRLRAVRPKLDLVGNRDHPRLVFGVILLQGLRELLAEDRLDRT